MATICRRVSKATGAISYVAQVRRKGTKPQSRSFERITDARAWARGLEASNDKGETTPGSKARQTTLADTIRRFLEGEGADWPTDRKKYLDEWREAIGFMTMAQLDTDAIIAERDRLARKGDLAPASINRRLAALSKVLTVAKQQYRTLVVHPILGAGLMLKEPKGRVRCLSSVELVALRDACKKSELKDLALFVEAALHTGARAGELAGLRWVDVDLEAGVAVLHETKNDKRHLIPIRGKVLEALRTKPRVCEFVFNCNGREKKDGTRYGFGPLQYKKAFSAAVKAAGISALRFHDLRHHAASVLTQNGTDLHVISKLLNHSSIAVTQRYAHLQPQQIDAAGDKLAELLR